MSSILTEIAERTRERVERRKREVPLAEVMREAQRMPSREDFLFEKALRKRYEPPCLTTPPFGHPSTEGKGTPPQEGNISFICEVKRASPSKGVIAEEFPYLRIAQEYQEAGADAVSVLTEPYYFKGDGRYLREIAGQVSVPLIRKDFTVDAYMIYEAKALGASAVLLICAILEGARLAEYIRIAEGLGLSALVETHDEAEVEMALGAEARIIGVNNRDLHTFEVDLAVSERLRRYVPEDRLFVSESGIRTPDDIRRLRAIGTDAVLIGEAFMRSPDKKAELARLRMYDEN